MTIQSLAWFTSSAVHSQLRSYYRHCPPISTDRDIHKHLNLQWSQRTDSNFNISIGLFIQLGHVAWTVHKLPPVNRFPCVHHSLVLTHRYPARMVEHAWSI